MKRKLTAVICAAALLLNMAACGKAPNENASSEPKQGNETSAMAAAKPDASGEAVPLHIHFMMPYAEDHALAKSCAAVAAEYKKINPAFEYEPEYISDSEAYYQKLKILISSDEAPDWFFGDPDTFTTGLRDKGILYDIDSLLTELGKKDRFHDITIEYPKFDDGTQYMMAVGANTEYFFYHPSMFEKAGVKAPATFDDFLKVCGKLQEAGITPIASNNTPWYILRYISMVPYRMTGNAFINEARTGKTKFHSEAGIAGAEFLQEIAGYFMDGWAGTDASTARDYFLNKSAAVWYQPTGSALDYVTDLETRELIDDMAYFTMPVLDGYDATKPTDYFANSGKGIMMLADSMNDEMKKYVSFFIDHFGDISYTQFNYLSGIKLSDPDILSECYKDMLNNFDHVATTDYAHVWDVRVDAATNEVLKAETINLAIGAITPEEWADRLDAAVAENAPAAFGSD